MSKKKFRKAVAIAAAAAMVMTAFTGCGGSGSSAGASGSAGAFLLSVNPEIEVEYDKDGYVVEVEGKNDDGKKVAEGYSGYEGRDCSEVVNEIVQKIYESGYFENTVDGHVKNIVIKLDDASEYPGDEFLKNVEAGVKAALSSCGIASEVVTVTYDDLDEQGYIGLDKAKGIVLAQMGLNAASFNNHEYDLEDGVYEFEFTANGIKYEYEVDALTGKVLKADFEKNDDWDDHDDWDDWEDFQDDRDDDNDDNDLDDDQDDNDDMDDSDDQDDDDDDDKSVNNSSARDDDDDDQDDDQDDDDDKPAASTSTKPAVSNDDDDDDDDDKPAVNSGSNNSSKPAASDDDDDDDQDDDSDSDDDDDDDN